jgi:DNA-nicking Smr family endonuclease
MNKKINHTISEEESQLFRDAIKNIKKTKSDKLLLRSKSKTPKVRDNEVEKEQKEYYLSDQIEKFVLPEEKLFFARNGVSPKQLRRLKQGKMQIADTLDLHGFTAEIARRELISFIERAYGRNYRCLEIIHGKGHCNQPVLKNKINYWLKQLDHVLAFCTALPKHGGAGALYVLIKSSKKLE